MPIWQTGSEPLARRRIRPENIAENQKGVSPFKGTVPLPPSPRLRRTRHSFSDGGNGTVPLVRAIILSVSDSVELTVYPAATSAAALVLAHGAGAGQASPFMIRVARGMAERGITAATFDFPYMVARRKAPDPGPVLEACWRSAIERARVEFGTLPLFIGGKSMGGRIASQVGAQNATGISGLVFLGYPLHPPGKPNQRRDAHLPLITMPMLFVQGTRDTFGTADEIRALLPRLQRASIYEVSGGDHSLKVTARSPVKQDEVMTKVMGEVSRWMLTLA
jgi:predicted alpha/beta-hydrolase family hydrolase